MQENDSHYPISHIVLQNRIAHKYYFPCAQRVNLRICVPTQNRPTINDNDFRKKSQLLAELLIRKVYRKTRRYDIHLKRAWHISNLKI